MGKVKKGSWAEINKTRKEEKRKWKEANLIKKLDKEKETAAENEVEETTQQQQQQTAPKVRQPTLSFAVPGSILETAQSPELRAYLSGQIARAACVFRVDEIVVFDDHAAASSAAPAPIRDSCMQLGRILQYLECPQYLRKHFFPIHHDLKYCGLLNPLNAPHHLARDDDFEYREGVVSNKEVKAGRGSFVNVGLQNEVQVDKLLTAGIRCTVKLKKGEGKKLKGTVVAPTMPMAELGVYWGYTIRMAESLAKVFSQCPFEEGYDVTIGTSDKGAPIDDFQCPEFKHVLIVFGGVEGLEFALENDNELDADDPKLIFDHYLNALPGQGSRTIRTEEAILVTLSALRPKLQHNK